MMSADKLLTIIEELGEIIFQKNMSLETDRYMIKNLKNEIQELKLHIEQLEGQKK